MGRKRAMADAVPSDERADNARRPDGPVPSGAGGGLRMTVLASLERRPALLRSAVLAGCREPPVGRAQAAWGPGARRGDNDRVAPFLGAATTQMAPNPLRPKGCRGTAPPAVLSLLDDVQGHRRRRAVLHPEPWRWQRDLREFFSSLLGDESPYRKVIH